MSSATQSGQQPSKPLLYVLGIVLIAAAAYLVVSLVGGGDETAEGIEPGVAAGSEVATAPTADGGGANASEDPSEIAAVEPTFEVFDARDPFEQLVADGTGSADSGTVDTTQPTSSTPTATEPAGSTTPTGDTAPSTPSSGGPSQTTVGATTIKLEDVYRDGGEEIAVVVVDDEGYEAAEGETVADVTVLDIEGSCATMRYEDNRFILCEGEQIQK